MAESKKYYWLKLKNTYFRQLEQKKMRKQESGKDMQIIYLKMMLCSVDKGGYIYYQGVYDSLEEELAEEFDEDIELVRKTVAFLIENHMISVEDENIGIFLKEASECIGSEGGSAARVRKHRSKSLQCNADVTDCNADVTECNTEIEKEIELELDKELESRVDYQLIADMYNNTCVSFPRVTKLSEARKRAIKARLKMYSLNDFKRLFEMAESSSFLKGQNGRNWSADFDWLIKDANMAKVLDGNYVDGDKRQQSVNEKSYELPKEYQEMYSKYLGHGDLGPDAPFQ